MLLALVAWSAITFAAPEAALDLRPSAPPAPRGLEEHMGSVARPAPAGVAGAGGLALVAADAAMVLGGGALLAATHRTGCEFLCVDPAALAVTLLGVAIVPPAFATFVADRVDPAGPGTTRALLAFAAQGAAVGLLVGAPGARSGPASTALLASALAVHLVGIPLALGFAPSPGAPGNAAPTLSYAARF